MNINEIETIDVFKCMIMYFIIHASYKYSTSLSVMLTIHHLSYFYIQIQIQIQKYLFRFKATGPLQAEFLN